MYTGDAAEGRPVRKERKGQRGRKSASPPSTSYRLDAVLFEVNREGWKERAVRR